MRLASAFALLALLASPGEAAENSCVTCHRTARASAYVAHNFADWEQSPHAQAGVACESCHGGDPSAASRTAAHEGVKPSTAKSSPTYFTAIPRTCGVCHQAELAAFQSSVHSKELQRRGSGPNCVTCHGAMADRVLGPREMEMTCTLCHSKPTDAFMARLSLDDSGAILTRLERSVRRAKAAGRAIEREQAALDEAYRLQTAALADWHTFDMAKVRAQTQEVKIRAGKALTELTAREKAAKP